MGEALKTFGAMKKMCNVRNVSLSLNSELYEDVVIPTVIYRAETCDMKEKGNMSLLSWKGSVVRVPAELPG